MIFLKKFLTFLGLLVLLSFSEILIGTAYAQDQTPLKAADSKVRHIDGVEVIVNTGFITRKEIDDRINALKKQGAKSSDDRAFRKEVVDRLIIEKIQIQNAEREGFSVTDKELNSIIENIAQKNKLTITEFKAKVVASGSSFEKYKELLRNDIMISRYREREIETKIKISDAEIDNFIVEKNRAFSVGGGNRSSPAAKGEAEEIDVAQIFIPAD